MPSRLAKALPRLRCRGDRLGRPAVRVLDLFKRADEYLAVADVAGLVELDDGVDQLGDRLVRDQADEHALRQIGHVAFAGLGGASQVAEAALPSPAAGALVGHGLAAEAVGD